MDSWIFKLAKRICWIAFAANIFIHAVIGASSINGAVKGTLSMAVMLILLIVLSKDDLKQRIKRDRARRKEKEGGRSKDADR